MVTLDTQDTGCRQTNNLLFQFKFVFIRISYSYEMQQKFSSLKKEKKYPFLNNRRNYFSFFT